MARIEVGSLHHLPKRIGKYVKIGNIELALFRLSNDHVYAVENRCPHRGGDLSQGIVSGEFLFCPMHDWKICMRDGNVQAPDHGCVKTYKVEIENEKIYVQL